MRCAEVGQLAPAASGRAMSLGSTAVLLCSGLYARFAASDLPALAGETIGLDQAIAVPEPSEPDAGIPIVDMAALGGEPHSSQRRAAVDALLHAARGQGVARLVNHGAEVEAVRRAGREYFALPAHFKVCPACSLRNGSVGL